MKTPFIPPSIQGWEAKPTPILNAYIYKYGMVEITPAKDAPLTVYVFPSLRWGLLFYYLPPEIKQKAVFQNPKNQIFQQEIPFNVVLGSITSPYQVSVDKKFGYILVLFKPGKFYELFPIPQYEFTDKMIEPELVYGRVIQEIQERLQEAPSPENRFKILDDYFLKCLSKATPLKTPLLSNALEQIHSSPILSSTSSLAEELGMSRRHLQRLFHNGVGVSPKFYMRITRFNRAFDLLQTHTHRNIAEIAQEVGYYDQAHMLKDFRELSGLNPTQLQDERYEFAHDVTCQESDEFKKLS